jgi:hypothetical protein
MTLERLTEDNYSEKILRFRDRQAGISLVYDPDDDVFTYNAYCLEIKLMKELFTTEHEFLEDALELINDEFGSWELEKVGTKEDCSTCRK